MDKEKSRILLAEDDPHLGMLLVDFLTSNGYEVILCRDGEAALNASKACQHLVYLLDVMMPKFDGFSLASKIRSNKDQTPIIFITAKSQRTDKLQGYNLGADDYITKPFDEEELLWKINALARRQKTESTPANTGMVSVGKYQFDHSNQLLILMGKRKRMTEKESDILNYLIQHPDQVIKRAELLKAVWGSDDYFLGRSLDVFITKIRKYLSDDEDLSIENVFGVGFVFNTTQQSRH